MKKSPIDASRCPICCRENECGVVAGAPDCWCFSQPALWPLPRRTQARTRGDTCLCRRCMASQSALDRALEQMARMLKQR